VAYYMLMVLHVFHSCPHGYAPFNAGVRPYLKRELRPLEVRELYKHEHVTPPNWDHPAYVVFRGRVPGVYKNW